MGCQFILSRTFRSGLYCGFVGNLISRVNQGGKDWEDGNKGMKRIPYISKTKCVQKEKDCFSGLVVVPPTSE